jgi:hypothetical protein
MRDVGRQFRRVNTIEVLDGEYVLLPLHTSTGAFIAEVRHLHRSGARRLTIPVAYISAFSHPGADSTYPHWCIRLFIRADVRYQGSAKRTITRLFLGGASLIVRLAGGKKEDVRCVRIGSQRS